MRWTSILAIWSLFWVLSAFLVLPFGVKTHEELGLEKVPGQVHSAPGNWNPKRIALRATILSAILFGAYYANYINHWITIDDLDVSRWMESAAGAKPN
ncbi:DUF1467 family protein [Novosphingobium cyanobacteriorum]|uniref:DUF1467 family protein n=1 Tax=Novosphingobium cyanobacteriorum TaxID=3024215 RepID=A0ABT6CCG3_9SPHN|nr:DUF1467 family protein [Novosphingobium cyanobacteriorum]MDF8331626.1 DUF1467 family protein [Novosphingobium cyanobacteriorum]